MLKALSLRPSRTGALARRSRLPGAAVDEADGVSQKAPPSIDSLASGLSTGAAVMLSFRVV
jgi:hypothetical protein